MFNKGKITLKFFLYFVAAIFLGLCVYAFIEGVTVITVENPYAVEQGSTETEGPLKKAIDKKSTVLCDVESFWAKYNVWGDTDVVYAPSENDEAAEKKVDENISCDEPFEDGARQ